MKTENISLSTNDKISLLSNFATMLGAGIPILETVDSLLDGAKGNQKIILETLRADLSQGQHVYTTFAKFPKVFNKVTVHVLRASEEAGTLEEALNDLRGNIRKEAEFTDKVKSALIYPAFIALVFFGVLLLMLLFVIPRISSVFSRLQVELPLPTKLLIGLSDMMLHNTVVFSIGFFVSVVVGILLYKKQKKHIIQAFCSLPIISQLVTEIDLNRFTRSLYLLLTSGIPITTALELCQEVVVKPETQKAVIHAKEMIMGGKKLSEGFKDNKNIFPIIMIKITEAGERSGSLDKAMNDIADYLDYQVSATLRTITALIEPVMLVVVGLLIGGMMLAIIAPIYSLISQVGS